MGICGNSYIVKAVSIENAVKLLTFGFTRQLKN